jgi:hypothetical protein
MGQKDIGAHSLGSVEWWQIGLARLNSVLLHAPWLSSFKERDLSSEDIERGWLGRPQTSESQLTELEERLGLRICPPYRALLQVSNGFAKFGEFVGRLLPSTEVDWYANRNPEASRTIDEYLKGGNSFNGPEFGRTRVEREHPFAVH